MANKLLSVTVRGKRKTWGFHFYGDPKNIQAWHDDGLEVWEVRNVIPSWVASLGLTKPWRFAQDLFNLRNPFR